MSGAEAPEPAPLATVPELPADESAPTEGAGDVWAPLRALTPARIGLRRAGDALATADQLELRLAHARARDAVHTPLDLPLVDEQLAGHPVVHVRSAAPDRATYLQRPDLGRVLGAGEEDRLTRVDVDVAFVIADGLSPLAAQTHAPAMIHATAERLPDWTVGPVVVATQARVALGDPIGEKLGARFVVVLIGERPGLSAADSLGIYLTHEPRTGRMDSERNCISNVRPPIGLSYAGAADKLVALIREASRLGLTGVELKDEVATLPAGGMEQRS